MNNAFLRTALLTLGIAIALDASAAVNFFVKLDGIDGESTAKGHEKWIEVESFSFGASHAGSGSGMGSGKTQFSPVIITQPIDSSTPQEFAALVGGQHIATGILDLIDAGAQQRKLFEYTFSDILLSDIQFTGASGDRPLESLTFDYAKLKLQAFGQDDKGAPIALPPVEFALSNLAPAPEPSTWALLVFGIFAAAMRGRRTLARRSA
jgi:type VI secretion system secreted protein Hcp